VPSNETGTYAVPPTGPPTGAYPFGPNGYGTQQSRPATNGAAYGVPPVGSNGYGVPQSGSATNGAPIYGAGPAPHGPVDPPTNGANAYRTGGYGAQQPGPAKSGTGSYGTGTYGVPSNGAGAYDTGGYRPQPDAESNGAAAYGMPQAGSTPSAYSTGSYGLQGPAADVTATYGAPPAAPVNGGNAYGTGSYGVPQLGQAADSAGTSSGLSFAPTNGATSADPGTGETSAWTLGSSPTTTGEHSRPAVPPGWAHETGSRRRRAVADSEQAAAAAPARPSEQAWAPSTPAAEPADPPPFAAPQSSSAPVEPPLDWRPSWADPDPGPVESAPATSDSATSGSAAWDSAASDWRPSWADPEPAAPAPSSDPLFGPLTGGLDPLPEPTATWSHVVNRPQRPAAPPKPDDVGTPLFAAYGAGAPAPVSGRRRREAGPEQLPHRAAPEGTGHARRYRETTDDRLSAAAPSRYTEEPRSGRRRAPEPAVEGRHDAGTGPSRHDAGAVTSRHGADVEARHADPGSGYIAQNGTAHRVPPTQWAWPKDPAAVNGEPEASTGKRAADNGPASWSAAELVDSPGYGGRRRRSENGRHGEPDDLEPGRHHRP
jgi:hypothetical protein